MHVMSSHVLFMEGTYSVFFVIGSSFASQSCEEEIEQNGEDAWEMALAVQTFVVFGRSCLSVCVPSVKLLDFKVFMSVSLW